MKGELPGNRGTGQYLEDLFWCLGLRVLSSALATEYESPCGILTLNACAALPVPPGVHKVQSGGLHRGMEVGERERRMVSYTLFPLDPIQQRRPDASSWASFVSRECVVTE